LGKKKNSLNVIAMGEEIRMKVEPTRLHEGARTAGGPYRKKGLFAERNFKQKGNR